MKKRVSKAVKINGINAGNPSADIGKLIKSLVEGQRRFLARRRDRLIKPSAPLIRKARRERAAQL